MAHYTRRVNSSGQEQFSRYLENTRSIHRTSEPEKPSNASDSGTISASRHVNLTFTNPGYAEDAESLRLELNTLQQKYDQLMEENKELRTFYSPKTTQAGISQSLMQV
uniref:Uncharacterized protein n=1 Tax=Sinocyclocheilus anshuiensis TaxID=1608454 RepID=A0A671MF14_9TELE